MKNKNSMMVVSRPGRFEKTAPTLEARASPTSPMVLQMLMQSIMTLNQKVDDLAVRKSQPLEMRPNTAAPIEVHQTKVHTLAPTPRQEVDRRHLHKMFD